MRVAFGDPPYPGQSKKHYGDHPDYAGEVDHVELIARLQRDFDGWCLNTSSTTLAHHWLFEVMGCTPADELIDLFPGSGAVTRAWNTWCQQLHEVTA